MTRNYPTTTTPTLRIAARAALAGVWLYHGLWNKLLAQAPTHAAVIHSVPFLGLRWGGPALLFIGSVEVALAFWVASGRRPRVCAITQTCLLVAMSAGGLLWAWHAIPDPGAMVVQNLALIALIWMLAQTKEVAHGRDRQSNNPANGPDALDRRPP